MKLPPFEDFIDDRKSQIAFDIGWHGSPDFEKRIGDTIPTGPLKIISEIIVYLVICILREYHRWLSEQMEKGDRE